MHSLSASQGCCVSCRRHFFSEHSDGVTPTSQWQSSSWLHSFSPRCFTHCFSTHGSWFPPFHSQYGSASQSVCLVSRHRFSWHSPVVSSTYPRASPPSMHIFFEASPPHSQRTRRSTGGRAGSRSTAPTATGSGRSPPPLGAVPGARLPPLVRLSRLPVGEHRKPRHGVGRGGEAVRPLRPEEQPLLRVGPRRLLPLHGREVARGAVCRVRAARLRPRQPLRPRHPPPLPLLPRVARPHPPLPLQLRLRHRVLLARRHRHQVPAHPQQPQPVARARPLRLVPLAPPARPSARRLRVVPVVVPRVRREEGVPVVPRHTPRLPVRRRRPELHRLQRLRHLLEARRPLQQQQPRGLVPLHPDPEPLAPRARQRVLPLHVPVLHVHHRRRLAVLPQHRLAAAPPRERLHRPAVHPPLKRARRLVPARDVRPLPRGGGPGPALRRPRHRRRRRRPLAL
eukprot:Sspe_Gene.51807::Locus_28739_Transcript_1_1_Confidence_1.000_Length_1569::g.51807::m.51807